MNFALITHIVIYVVDSFSLLFNIPWCEYATAYLCILLSRKVGLLWFLLLKTILL